MHANAHGASIHESNLDALLKYANSQIPDGAFDENFYPVDYIFKASEHFDSIILQVGGCPSYWGNGIDEPTAVVENIVVKSSQVTVMGKDKNTLKFELNGVTYIKFRADLLIQEIEEMGEAMMNVYGKFNLNEWAGRITPQFFIDDYDIKDAKYAF